MDENEFKKKKMRIQKMKETEWKRNWKKTEEKN